jgi:putative transposase
MKRSRFSEEQIIGILREAQAGSPVKAVCAAHNISGATYHAWKRKYGGMDVSEARRLRGKRHVADRLPEVS